MSRRPWSPTELQSEKDRIAHTLKDAAALQRTEVAAVLDGHGISVAEKVAALCIVRSAAWHDARTVRSLVDYLSRRVPEDWAANWFAMRLSATTNLTPRKLFAELQAMPVALGSLEQAMGEALVTGLETGLAVRHDVAHNRRDAVRVRVAIDWWDFVLEWDQKFRQLLA
ncbi:hypothetical protein ACVU7I_00625 [Patulibacter sp. S7RM1-6]